MPDRKITPPPGYTLETPASGTVAPPPGYTLESSAPAAAEQIPAEPSLLSQVGTQAKEFVKGLLKGAGSTISSADEWSRKHLPAFMTNTAMGFGKPEDIPAWKQTLAPTNTAQSIGKGVEQAGEFLLPGLGEETAATSAAKLVPFAGRAAKPVARLLYNAGTTGLINKAQGGNFDSGAILGGGTSAIGEAGRLIAPHIAESAIGIRKIDRAYGRRPGEALLEETRGFTPSSVAESAQEKLNELNPQLEAIAKKASSRPLNIRGFLPPPAEEIPLGEAPTAGKMPGGLFSAQPFPPQNVGEARIIRDESGRILPKSARKIEFPDESGKLPIGRNYNGQFLTRQPSRKAFMSAHEGGLAETPPLSGPGVLLRHPEIEPFPLPTTQENRSASLFPARQVVGGAIGKATEQNAAKEFEQLQPLNRFLHERFHTGETIPENVTPSDLLNLRRGFGNEFVHTWNPETTPGVTGTARKTYGALTDEFHRTVPEAVPLDRRISGLIPVAKRARSVELNAPFAQRVAGRIGAHTGALTGAIGGGLFGYSEGGPEKAIEYGLGGLLLPELAASPTGQLALSRSLYRQVPTRLIRSGAGAFMSAARQSQQ